MSTPTSPIQTQSPIEDPSSPVTKRTRTVAIVKNHALDHRFDIEMKMTEAGFEIVKERQMEFDVDTDPDTMFELFGEDYVCFAEGPVRVYVLERRRAVQVWHTLMGPSDPELAKQEAPSSIRALYGLSKEQNAVMGAPDAETAEVQIQTIFASSPPFPTTDLPSDPLSDGAYSQGALSYGTNGTANGTVHSRSSSGTNGTARGSLDGKLHFKARVVPATHNAPDIVPRMSRAAALRAGVVDIDTSPRRRLATAESIAKTFAGVPGHKRSETITVASTAPPVVAPRMTRAASLRLGQAAPVTPPRPSAVAKSKSAGAAPSLSSTFDGVPGHKRRESIQVGSTKPPAVSPRTNRSAELRAKKEAAPPSSFSFRDTPTLSRSSSRNSINQPSNVTRPPTRPASAASMSANGSARPALSRTSSRPSTAGGANSKPLSVSSGVNKVDGSDSDVITDTPVKPKARLSVSTPPTIVPRTNKSAALRAAKMALAGGGLPANGTKPPAKKAVATPVKTALRA